MGSLDSTANRQFIPCLLGLVMSCWPFCVLDAVYKDPLGELPQRPRTAARAKPLEDDEFLGAELTDLLPE